MTPPTAANTNPATTDEAPAASAASAAESNAAAAPAQAAGPSAPASPAVRILVVDDDVTDRMAVRRALTAAGVDAEIEEADCGEAAILRLSENAGRPRLDCVLMDNLLPDYDGLEMLAHLDRAGVTTPVIMMTGQGSEQLAVDLMKAGAADYLSKNSVSTEHFARSVRGAIRVDRAEQAARAAAAELAEQTRITSALNRVGQRLVLERDLRSLLQLVTDEATALVGARFGAFFYNVLNDRGESYTLYTLSGVPREAFEKFPMPRNTALFGPTFEGVGPVRLDDVTADPRYGKSAPYHGMPPGHLPVHSYLAVPVVSRSGTVIGGLFFGHEQVGVFKEGDERLVVGLASQAAVAIDNVRLYDALRRGEEQYRFLAEAIPQIVWTAQSDGRLDYINDVFARYTGIPAEAGQGEGWAAVVHEADLAVARDRWQQSLATGDKYETEFRIRRADGAFRWHLIRATAMRDAEGRTVRWFGTCTDVHDWRHAQQALRVQRERLDLVLSASQLGLWYCDLPFSTLEWNAKCKEHFHFPHDATVTMDDFIRRLHPDDREPTRAAIERSIADRGPYDIVYRAVCPNSGAVHWIRAIGRAFYDVNGTPIRFDGITVDVTGPKEAEQALRQAKEAAEAANVAKDRFLAVLSHELRTPLMPVLTEVAALEMDPSVPTGVAEALKVIRRNVELEARLIDDLLDLTRISKGKLQLNFDTVDLHAVAQSALDICAADVVARKLTTTLDLSATRHHVRGDAARLQQVFWNLIKNAIKFTPPGGHVTIHSYDDPAGALSVRVTDTGIGVEPEALERIFDAFEQADQSVTKTFGGLGLGLAISKALIDLHGGTLSASSGGANKGATFTIGLRPVAPASPHGLPHDDTDQSDARAPGAPGSSGNGDRTLSDPPAGSADAPADRAARPATARPIHILLVDDHHDTNRAMARLLERMGYRVRTADSVASALAAAAEVDDASGGADLLISDIGLPDGSGLDLMRRLLAQNPRLKGIALSGFGMEEDVRKSKEAGFYEHLIKPINFARLEAAIRDLTDGAESPNG